MRVVERAPGKVFLIGEYAVLDGAPALVGAVDRYAVVRYSPRKAKEWLIRAPQMGAGDLRFTLGASGRTRWRGGVRNAGVKLGLTAAMLRAMLERLAPPEPGRTGATLEIDTAELHGTGPGGKVVKLGLGSSSAVTAALWRALLAGFDREPALAQPARALRELISHYRTAQGGHGSGADLAASLYGGMIRYRLVPQGFSVRRVSLPAGLVWCFVFTGRATQTSRHLVKFYHWRRTRPASARGLLARLAEQADHGVRAARTGDAGTVMSAIKAYAGLLEQLGDAMGAPVVSRTHRLAGRLAENAGVCYKPCGAGGGDIGVAVSDDAERLATLEPRLKAAGLQVLPFKLLEDVREHTAVQVQGK